MPLTLPLTSGAVGGRAPDRECFHEFCDLPAEQCQVDHIEPHAAGGKTTQGNGRMACGHHNRDRHRPPETPPPP
ncbi:MAG: HNH endonuclease signature motif containing protein [Candidatus Methylomirabilales bacterium]